jgi:hypothetical protein
MTNENKKTSYQLIFVRIFMKKHSKNNLENFITESQNATSTPLMRFNQWLRVGFKLGKNVFMNEGKSEMYLTDQKIGSVWTFLF